jgi:RNA polymerase sigma-70 factor (ECF subfamily)
MLTATPIRTTSSNGRLEHARVDAARRGDRAAFASIHERYASMVHGILLAHVPPQDAEDLVQEVFLQAMRKLPTLRDPAALGSWLAMIARNTAALFHRTRRASADLPDDLEGTDRAPHDAQTLSEARRVLSCIGSLPDAYRETLILRLVEQMSGPEIADRTGMTAASVRVNLHRGMKLLRAQLGVETSAEERP